MAVPKGKTSKARKHARSANWKVNVPAVVDCPHCHEKKVAHQICKKCGYYDGEQKIADKKADATK